MNKDKAIDALKGFPQEFELEEFELHGTTGVETLFISVLVLYPLGFTQNPY